MLRCPRLGGRDSGCLPHFGGGGGRRGGGRRLCCRRHRVIWHRIIWHRIIRHLIIRRLYAHSLRRRGPRPYAARLAHLLASARCSIASVLV